MNKKWILALSAVVVLLVGAFVLFRAIGATPAEAPVGETAVGAADDGAQSSEPANQTSDSPAPQGGKAEAEKLIGESLSREEIEAALGACTTFDMNSAGCERGVYAGEFYYDGFTIFSRTYDKGKTFRIISVNT